MDTASSSGDVKISVASGSVTDTFDDESKIAAKTNLVVTGGQVKLSPLGPLTLRPNGAGSATTLSRYPGTGEANWQDVDEETADEDGTYVYRSRCLDRRICTPSPTFPGRGRSTA